MVKEIYCYFINNLSVFLSWLGVLVNGIIVFVFKTKYKAKIEHDFSVTLESKKSEFQKSLHDYGNFVEKRNQIYRKLYENAQIVLGAFPCISGPINYPIFDDNNKEKNLEILKSYFPNINTSIQFEKNNSYDYWIKNYIRNEKMDRLYNNFCLLNELYFSNKIENICKEIYDIMVVLENHTYSLLKFNLDYGDYKEIYNGLIKKIDVLKKTIKKEITNKN